MSWITQGMGKIAAKPMESAYENVNKGFQAGNKFMYGENPTINPNYARMSGLMGPGGAALGYGMDVVNQPFSHHFITGGIKNLFSDDEPTGGGRMAGALGTQVGMLPGLLGFMDKTGKGNSPMAPSWSGLEAGAMGNAALTENFPNTSYDQWGNPVTIENAPLGTTGGGIKHEYQNYKNQLY